MRTSTNRSTLTIVALIVLACIFACQCFAVESAAKAPAKKISGKIGDKAASLEGMTFVKGKPVTFKKGSVYVVEFWATWCGPCRKSIPHLTKIQKEFKDKGVTVIGITNEKDLEKVKKYVTKQGENMNYTVAADPARKISAGYMKAYNQRGIPAAFIVDKKSNIAWVGHPMSGMDDVLKQVVDGTFDVKAYASMKAEKDAKQAATKAQKDAENSKLQKIFTEYFDALESGDQIEKARLIAEKLIASNNSTALNTLAMQIMSSKKIDDAKRDYKTALKAVKIANTITKGKDLRTLNTYAMALSKNGKHKKAIDTIRKALALSKDNKRVQDYLKKQLATYRKALEEQNTPASKEQDKE